MERQTVIETGRQKDTHGEKDRETEKERMTRSHYFCRI